MRRVFHAGLALALLTTLLAGCAPRSTTTDQLPRFEPSACSFRHGAGIVDGQNVHCGWLVVPEDHAHSSGRTIKLAVVRFQTHSATPAPDPVIYLAGGPGESPLTDYAPNFTAQSLGYLLGDRDLIFFDPRGAAFSQPSLDCPELRDALYGAFDQNLTAAQYDALYADAMMRCHARLIAAGIDLSLYNTATAAADVHDLIRALGYKAVNLVGGSYGARLGLALLHAYPQGIRSVVLDSTFPPQVNLFTSVPASATRAFNLLFAQCAASSTCNARYPHLDTMLYSLIARLDAHPLTIHAQDAYGGKPFTVLLNGTRLAALLFLTLYASDAIPSIPRAIAAAGHGDATLLTQFYNEVGFTEDAVARGLWFSVECREDAPFVTPHDVDVAEQAYAPAFRAADLFNLQTRLGVCQFWNVASAPAAEKEAVTSAIPTLLLAGEDDPITPPSNDELAARTLSNGYVVLFPGLGHGVQYTGPCPTQIIAAFQRDPTRKPDTNCVSQLGEPAFT